jgi:hypothetical protein
MAEHWGCNQVLFQFLKGILAVCIKQEGVLFAGQAGQWSCYVAIFLDKLLIEVTEAEE